MRPAEGGCSAGTRGGWKEASAQAGGWRLVERKFGSSGSGLFNLILESVNDEVMQSETAFFVAERVEFPGIVWNEVMCE